MVSENSRRIARNTVLLYIRTLFSQLLALYTSRKILEILGVEDFGIYNVVGGVVSMLTFLNGSMSVATQRFLTIELGRNDLKAYNRVFNMSCLIHIALALLIVITAETVGLWFVNNCLNIPNNRMVAANCIYQTSILSIVVGIVQTPYYASVTAHEHLNVYAYLGMGEAILRLAIVFLLLVINYDHLIVYGILGFGISLLSSVIIWMYVIHNFNESRFKWQWDSGLFRSMLDFTGWNLFGTIAWLLKGQGCNILMNIFGGPAVNAARGVSFQVSNAIQNLVNGFSTAVNPQLTKNYAAGNRNGLFRLMFTSSKISFFLLLAFALPIMIEIPYILRLWLVNVPAYAVLFTKLVLLEALLNTYGGPMVTGLMATGNIKWYQIVVGCVMLLIIPISYIFLRIGFSIATPLIVSIGIMALATALRLWFCKRQLGLSVMQYLYKVIFPTISVFLLSSVMPIIISTIMETGFLRLLVVIAVSIASVTLLTYSLGLDFSERLLLRNAINKIFHRFFK